MKLTNEQNRLQALARYRILDTPPDGTFDRITALLARLLSVPYSCVAIVDAERVWFKAAHGLEATEVPRQPGFCHAVVETGELQHYSDATRDARSLGNDLARGEEPIRFYVGAPLISPEGLRLGTLCAFSPEPRTLSDSEAQCVRDLTELVMHEIESRRAQNQLERTEAVLRHSQRLESVGLVASGVAHDFNNLLGGILGNVGVLRHREEFSEEAKGLLEEIEVVARRAADLSSQVLAYAGRESESIGASVDLNCVIQDTSYLLDASIHENTELRLELAEGLPLVVGDATAMRQLVMNLIVNASEAYRGAQGVVRLTTRRGGEDRVILEVADDGVGMDLTTRERFLEAFFTTKVGGRGLGMAVVRRILEQTSGEIDVRSDLGEGTRITVTLAKGEQESVGSHLDARVASDWHADGVVIVVDDEQVIRLVVQRVLRRVGLETLTASSGEEALRLFEEHRERLVMVILDLSMPVMDGAQVLRAMHAVDPDLPVILSSGHRQEDVIARVAGERIAAFLAKPFTADKLVGTVREVFERGCSTRAR